MKFPGKRFITVLALVPALSTAGWANCPGPGCPSSPRSSISGAIIGGIIGAGVINRGDRNSTSSRSLATQRSAKQVQTALNLFGFDAGTVDGALGKKSRAAIAQYQTALGEEATGNLTPIQRRVLITSYNRVQAAGDDTARLFAQNPQAAIGFLSVSNHELREQVVATASVQPVPSPATLPIFSIGDATSESIRDHCSKVSVITQANGGFATNATEADPETVLGEQFCQARVRVISQAQEIIAQIPQMSPDQVATSCQTLEPAMQGFVTKLPRIAPEEMQQDLSEFVDRSGQTRDQMRGTGIVCLGVGYQQDNAKLALSANMLLFGVGERAYGELIAYQLLSGLGIKSNSEQAAAWYRSTLSTSESGTTQALFQDKDRSELMRKAAFRLEEEQQAD